MDAHRRSARSPIGGVRVPGAVRVPRGLRGHDRRGPLGALRGHRPAGRVRGAAPLPGVPPPGTVAPRAGRPMAPTHEPWRWHVLGGSSSPLPRTRAPHGHPCRWPAVPHLPCYPVIASPAFLLGHGGATRPARPPGEFRGGTDPLVRAASAGRRHEPGRRERLDRPSRSAGSNWAVGASRWVGASLPVRTVHPPPPIIGACRSIAAPRGRFPMPALGPLPGCVPTPSRLPTRSRLRPPPVAWSR